MCPVRWDSTVRTVTALQSGQLWFDSWQGQRTLLFSQTSASVSRSTQPPIEWVRLGKAIPGQDLRGTGS
jgi:hypothetical protein